jgi:[acyl-carrier-protein] S-malonyltransferase
MLVVAVPGQGAQSPGFLAPWLELPGVADRLAAWSELAGCDLVRCGSTASADEIRDTAVAQPLIVAAALTACDLLAPGQDLAATPAESGSHGGLLAAGHSVGELAAGVIAGILDAQDAMRLVKVRGQAMAQAAAATPTSMTAVLGGDMDAVLSAIASHGLTPANINGAGQIVAAGTAEQLAAFAADPPPRARLRPLQVAGAFHTKHMAPAVDALRDAAAGLSVRDPALPIVSNADGAVVRSGPDWLERIITQVSAPVRWDLCMQAMARMGATALIELPPAGTLTGLAHRELRGIKLLAVKGPDDLAAAREMLAEHADGHFGHSDCHPPDWRLLVAPHGGTFRSLPGDGGAAAGPGAVVGSGSELGRVEMRGGSHSLTASFPATIIEWLVEDGDPISPGQPLVRLQPAVPD